MANTNMNYDALVAHARKTNMQRSNDERKSGLEPPEEASPPELLKIVESALQAGIKTKDWNAIAEGYVMLIDYFNISTAS